MEKMDVEGENGVRMGVVMTGAGVHAAAAIGVLAALERRGMEPEAVCGVLGGAWPAALFAAGMDLPEMNAAALTAGKLGRRLILPGASCHALAHGRARAVFGARRLDRLLVAQAGQRPLALCPRPAVFLCRSLRAGNGILFSTRSYAQDACAMLTMQVSLSFAARAALAAPPVLPVMSWMGAPVLPLADMELACRQLFAMGMHRVLVVAPQLSPRTDPDALDLAAAAMTPVREPYMEHTAVLRVPMDDGITALSLEKLPACVQAGSRAAERELDDLLGRMGMACCRVLPFRRERA